MSIEAIQYVRSLPARDGQKLLPSELHLLLLLATYCHPDEKIAWPSVGRLAREMGYCERRVQQLIRSLQRKALLRVRCREADGQGRQLTNLYSFPGRDGQAKAKPVAPTPEAHFTNPAKPSSPTPLKPASPYRKLEREKKERERNENLPPCEGERFSLKDVLARLGPKCSSGPQPRRVAESDRAWEKRKKELDEQANTLRARQSGERDLTNPSG